METKEQWDSEAALQQIEELKTNIEGKQEKIEEQYAPAQVLELGKTYKVVGGDKSKKAGWLKKAVYAGALIFLGAVAGYGFKANEPQIEKQAGIISTRIERAAGELKGSQKKYESIETVMLSEEKPYFSVMQDLSKKLQGLEGKMDDEQFKSFCTDLGELISTYISSSTDQAYENNAKTKQGGMENVK